MANWSSADVSSFAAELGASFSARLWATALGFRADGGSGSGSFDLGGEELAFGGLTVTMTIRIPIP